ncbi:H/ACA RNA-protein complex protein Gar1 [Candidatus Bathyarchaeota archaeon]|nr:MAG: H/ACA RNA-protein complex protein Gar1 [Candidatus Bathyarchaeota archaeon]TMI32765.1 MAG: H/ACA RNA-protein complex protein Gar1 [Candidatus Bathyarchaeota archaeon]
MFKYAISTLSTFTWSVPGAGLRRLGKVLHLSKSGNLILRLETSQRPPPVGASVCDYKLRKVGIVNNILGPVKAPYASVQPTGESPSTLAGRIVYLVEN